VLARVLEAAGLATVSLSLIREHTEMIKPPRALWVPFPFGLSVGHPNDLDEQRRVLLAAFALLEDSVPVLRDLTSDDHDSEPPSPVQASAVTVSTRRPGDVAAELSQMRRYHERWQARTSRTAVGLTGVPPQQFRGLVRFLEAYVRGEDADHRGRPSDLSLPYFIRYSVDDLKALYVEARFVMCPDDDSDSIQRWLWADTALSRLISDVRDRMAASDDRTTRRLAQGIAR
jgi:hypothetical protein